MKKKLRAIYIRQIFSPGWLGLFVNPFYFARSGLRRAMEGFAPELSGRLLDVGCGSKPYQSLFSVTEYVGLDIESEVTRKAGIADYLYDGVRFPFEDAAFDSVLCNQVLEHVFNPDEFLGEIRRVLKPSGKLLLTVPFVWDEHEQPYDYARYSSFGLRALLEKHGFRIQQHIKLNADASILFQLANAYLFKITQHLPRSVQLLLTVSVMALINVTGVIASKLLPDNPDLFLDHVVLAERIS
jgi:SAM-dependent methyltransferase